MIFYFTTTNGNSGATIASSKSHVTGGNRVAGTSIPNVTDSLLFHPSHTPCTTRRARTHGRAHTRSHTRTHTTTAVAQFQPEAEGTFRRTHTSPFEARDAPARAPTHTRERGECEVRGAHTHTVPTHSAAPDTRTREFANTHTRTETRSLSFLSLCITPFIGRLVFTPSSSLFSFPGLHTLPRFCFVSSLSSTSIPSSRHAPPSSPTTVSNHHRQSFSIKRVIVFIRPHIRCLKATVLIRQHRRTAPYISVFLHASHIAVGRLSFSIWPRPRFNRTFLSLYDFSSTQ